MPINVQEDSKIHADKVPAFHYHFLFLVSANHENFEPGNEEGSNKKSAPMGRLIYFLPGGDAVSLCLIIDHIRISI